MERSPLANREKHPDNEQIAKYLQEAYPVYEEFSRYFNDDKNGLAPVWMYYNDVKYWLCKVQHKKKTIFWLTIWEGYFKLTLYFKEESTSDVEALEIDPAIKEQHKSNQMSGKIRPVTLDINHAEQLPDAYTLIQYKRSLK